MLQKSTVSLAIVALALSQGCKELSQAVVSKPDVHIVLPADPGGDDKWRVLLDPGHGGKSSRYPQLGTPGEYSSSEDPARKRPEREVNLEVAQAVEKALSQDPRFTVLMTRTRNVAVSLTARAEMSNSERVDAFLSIHSNAVQLGKPKKVRDSRKGFTPIFSHQGESAESEERSPIMAAYLAGALVDAGFTPAGIGISPDSVADCKEADFISYWPAYGITSIWDGHPGLTVLTRNKRPAVLLETHYMSSPADVEEFQRKETIARFSDAVHRGLVAFLQSPTILTTSATVEDPLTRGIRETQVNKDRCSHLQL